ncbi:aat, partial [Symbiodinium microadriaticum]
RTNFVVSQGQGALNRTFMQTSADLGSPNVPKDILVFAGVRTGSGQGLVDSAAEEGVIGSGAFARLKDALTQQGLRPIQVRGPAGACAGIGGNAQVLGIWDVPIGHRAISVVEFAGRWQLPREMQRGGKDPFQLPRN